MVRLRSDWVFAAVDAVTVAVAYAAAMIVRFMDVESVAVGWWRSFLVVLPLIVVVHWGANLLVGAYGHVWELASVEEAMRLVAAAALAGVTLVAGLFTWEQFTSHSRLVPISVLLLGDVLALGGMGAMRYRSRMFSFNRSKDLPHPAPTIVVGTGRAAAELARTGARGQFPMQVVGFVSSNGDHHEKRIAGLPVLGHVRDLPAIIAAYGIEEVVIEERLDNDAIRDLVDRSMGIDVRLRIVPHLDDVLGNGGHLTDMRDLELTDLLPRATVDTDLDDVRRLLTGRRVLITGAGGSIGSEITRQVMQLDPAAVVAVDNDETHLYEAALSWREDGTTDFTTVLCDIRDRDRLNRVFAHHQPHVVFHAAAHKHVPILEECPDEAVKTNVTGTRNLLDTARRHHTERFVLISTDKAVDPTSVMGATKRVAEMMIQSANANHHDPCVYTAVRFGNVLGSRGSVVPTFMRQIQTGGPVTVSDPNMLRYFMTVNEAVHLVLQAAALANGGEVFVLDMGEPVRIGDLARRMIRLAGLVPGRDIQIAITGVRPGEKHAEVLSRDALQPSPHPKISITTPTHPGPVTLHDATTTLTTLANHGDTEPLRNLLHALAWHTWTPNETINLTQLDSTPRPAHIDIATRLRAGQCNTEGSSGSVSKLTSPIRRRAEPA
jgi:FlaA1/EpsC-like NDP-sugar epimerase